MTTTARLTKVLLGDAAVSMAAPAGAATFPLRIGAGRGAKIAGALPGRQARALKADFTTIAAAGHDWPVRYRID